MERAFDGNTDLTRGVAGQPSGLRGDGPYDITHSGATMDLELARGIFLGLLALVGVGGIIDMFRQ